jgi:hypothetical protein
MRAKNGPGYFARGWKYSRYIATTKKYDESCKVVSMYGFISKVLTYRGAQDEGSGSCGTRMGER